jgi:hypothetical protein
MTGNPVADGDYMDATTSRLSVITFLAVACAACATIVGHPTQTIPVSSVPGDAAVWIVDEAGMEVFKGVTPTTVTLLKSTGKYWGKKSYTVTITKPGFQSQTIPIAASATGWYLAGNLVFGGLIGWFIVDPFNGNMYTLSPEAVAGTLAASTTHNNKSRDGSITIVLLEDVPMSLRGEMVAVH